MLYLEFGVKEKEEKKEKKGEKKKNQTRKKKPKTPQQITPNHYFLFKIEGQYPLC